MNSNLKFCPKKEDINYFLPLKMCYKCVWVIFYLETWSSPDMTRSLIGQLLMSYTICFPTKRRIETVPTAEDFHSTPPTGGVESIRGNSVCLYVCLSVCTSSLQHFQSRAFKSSQNHVGPNILYIIG